jgi:biopolymer transport protein ExbD
MAIGGAPNSFSEDEDDAIFSEINITPLTDVFLVLLIIFMVTSTVITQSGVKVNLPKAGAASTAKQSKGVTVSIDATGKLFINEQPVSYEALENAIRTQLSNSTDMSVILAGDKAVPLGDAMKVMDIAKKAGATHFAIATKTNGKKEP